MTDPADHSPGGGRFAGAGCQACAEPWPCPTERIRRSLARIDAPASERDPQPLTVDEEAAEIMDAHARDGMGDCRTCEKDWTAAHVVALLRARDLLAQPDPRGFFLTPVPGVTLTADESAAAVLLARQVMGTATGPGGTPGGAG